MNRNLIETYAAGGEKLRRAVQASPARTCSLAPAPATGRFKSWSSISPTATQSPSIE